MTTVRNEKQNETKPAAINKKAALAMAQVNLGALKPEAQPAVLDKIEALEQAAKAERAKKSAKSIEPAVKKTDAVLTHVGDLNALSLAKELEHSPVHKAAEKAVNGQKKAPAAKKTAPAKVLSSNLPPAAQAAVEKHFNDVRDWRKKREAAIAKKTAAKKTAAKKTAVKKSAPAKKAAPAVDGALTIRLYGKGEFVFHRALTARIGDASFMVFEANGKKITLTPTKKEKGAQRIMFSHTQPVLRVAKLLKLTGWSAKTQNLVAKPVGDVAFSVEVK